MWALIKKELWYKEVSVATFDFNAVDGHIHKTQPVATSHWPFILLSAPKG